MTLLKWLDAAASGVSDWLLCYNHTGPGINVTAFHVGCDYVGATVTLLKVGDYVFGGFSNENWGGMLRNKFVNFINILKTNASWMNVGKEKELICLYVNTANLQGVPKKEATIHIQISALIQTTYCSSLKSLSLLNDQCVKTHSFTVYTRA